MIPENLAAVIAANKELQRRVNLLNVRAGSAVFPIMTTTERLEWLKSRLSGAVSMATIPDVESLRFPAIDEEVADLILQENPDAIMVCSVLTPVVYKFGSAPSVILEGDRVIQEQVWKNLPDEGIMLPGGRVVEVNVKFSYYDSFSGQNIPQLKEKVKNYLNSKQWSNWPSDSHPMIELPDLAADSPVIPEIITAQYGTCVVEGTSLVAYGSVVVKRSRYYTSDPWFEAKWFQSQVEAEAARANAVQKLGEIREEVRKQQELAQAKLEVEEAQKLINSLYDLHYYNMELSSALRERVYSLRYGYIPSSLDEMKQHVADTKALVAEVEAVVAKISRRKAEEEADLSRAVAAGEIFVDFSVWHRRGGMTGNGDGWVILPDGLLRSHDSSDARPHKSDGNRIWNRVGRTELALRWTCGHRGDIAGNSEFVVAKLPVGGVTQEQLAAVREIEEEIGAPIGAFGLDKKAKEEAEKRLQAIRDAAEKILGYAPDFGYYQVIGENGVMIENGERKFRVNLAAAFDQFCDGRDAQVVRSVRTADGMLEFLAYEKYGTTNIAMRWRGLREDEKATTPVIATETTLAMQAIATPASGEWASLGKGWWRCPEGHSEKAPKSATQLTCGQCGATKEI